MTTTTDPTGVSAQPGRSDTDCFMLTLCRLHTPVTIRPSQSPQLRQFTLFTSRARQRDGSERLYLHMGYFETLRVAQQWLQILRGRFPDAIATLAPPAFRRQQEVASSVASAEPASGVGAEASSGESPAQAAANLSMVPARDDLTDSQVLRVLQTRRGTGDALEAHEEDERVALLRPDDTVTRLALKDAVDQGAPVSFAVQLQWSDKPIDLGPLASHPVLKTHTLYATETRRGGVSRYFLRLGFFADPISARDVATAVHAHFPTAAVVPVSDEEIASAGEAALQTTVLPVILQQRGEAAADSDRTTERSSDAKPENGQEPRAAPRRSQTLERTLEQLAARESWTEPDEVSDSGVRHLRVEVLKRSRTPWRWSSRSR